MLAHQVCIIQIEEQSRWMIQGIYQHITNKLILTRVQGTVQEEITIYKIR
mgnify:CR=1 FL=1